MTYYSRKNFTILILVSLIIILVVPNVLAENQSTGTSAFQTPVLKFNDTGRVVTISQGFTVNPAYNPAPPVVGLEAASPQSPANGYVIPTGSVIYHSDNNTTRIFDSGGNQQVIISDTGSSSIPTPGGYLPATRIYQVPSGSVIDENGNVTVVSVNGERILTVIDQRQPSPGTGTSVIPVINGWIEDSDNWNYLNLAQFIAYWKVPVSPPSPEWNTVDFLFNGIEPAATGAAIVQPVLEWNWGGTSAWTGRSWYVGPSGSYHTDPIYVYSGQTIEGTLVWDNNYHLWNITTADQQTGQSVTIFSSQEPEVGTTNLAAFCTYEGYGVYDNSDAPGTTTFYNMRFRDINGLPVVFPWNPRIIDNSLPGLNVLVTSQSMVTLVTANPGLPPTITGVVPVTRINTTPDLNLSITGTNFWGTPSVKLVRSQLPGSHRDLRHRLFSLEPEWLVQYCRGSCRPI